MPNPIAYVEIPSDNVPASKQFYAALFGWTFEDWGPDYAAFKEGLDGGFNGDPSSVTAAPLVVLQTDDIDALAAKLHEAGGTITMPIFSYPGGRRFHFKDPSGQELAVMQVA